MSGCNLSQLGVYSSEQQELKNNCSYLFENTKSANDNLGAYGYWLETPEVNYYSIVSDVYAIFNGQGYFVNNSSISSTRPVIEVPKTKISY